MSSYSLDSVKSTPTLIDVLPVAPPPPTRESNDSDFREHLEPPAASDEPQHASNSEVQRDESDGPTIADGSESAQDQQTGENNETRSEDGETSESETSSEVGESVEAAPIEPVVVPDETQELADVVVDGSRAVKAGAGGDLVKTESAEKGETEKTVANVKELPGASKPTPGELSDGPTDSAPAELARQDSRNVAADEEVTLDTKPQTQTVVAENTVRAASSLTESDEPVVAALPEKTKVTRETTSGQTNNTSEGDRPIAPLPTSFEKNAWAGQGGSSNQSNPESNPGELAPETPADSGPEGVTSGERAPRLREQLQPIAHRQGPSGLRPTEQARFVNRVARAFESMGNREGELRIRLSPPELGSMRLSVRVENGALAARLETDTPMARQALLDGLPVLRERLAEQGIRIEQFSVDIADRHPGHRPGDDIQQHDQRRQPGSPREQHDEPETERRRQRPVIQQDDNLDVVV